MGLFDFFKRTPAPAAIQKRRFLGATFDRLTSSWLTNERAINEDLRGDLDALRSRSRDLAKNNALARRFTKLVGRNVVGSNGFILQARVMNGPGKPDTLANAAIELAWSKWSKRGSADITGRQSFADLCRAVAIAVARDGEAIIQIIRADARNPEHYALRHLDTARLDTSKNRAAVEGQNAVMMGIEIDGYSRPVAYYLRAQVGSGASARFEASEILHVFLPENAEQVRGIPWMHATMLDMHDLGEFHKSALLNARRSADSLGFLVSPDGTAGSLADETVDGQPIKISAPGVYDILPDGYDIKTPEYAYPNTVFEPFTKAFARRMAMGMDVAAHNLTGDMTDVNYSSARIAELEERDMWVTLQNWFIEAFIEPVYAEWFASAMTYSSITMPNGSPLPIMKAEKFSAHEWQGRRWAWVDPKKDIEAARMEVKTGIASPQMIAARNGVDIEDVLDSIAAFEAMLATKKVTLVDYEITPSMTSEMP